MSKTNKLLTLVTIMAMIGFSTAAHAGGKQDCISGIKVVEKTFENEAGMGGGGKKLVATKLAVAKDALKAGKFKKCKNKVAEMKKIMSLQ